MTVEALVYCRGRGTRRNCRELVPLEGDRLCEKCRAQPVHCVVCDTGCDHWYGNRCGGHSALAEDYPTEVDLLREQLAWYTGSHGRMVFDAKEQVARIEARLVELAQAPA